MLTFSSVKEQKQLKVCNVFKNSKTKMKFYFATYSFRILIYCWLEFQFTDGSKLNYPAPAEALLFVLQWVSAFVRPAAPNGADHAGWRAPAGRSTGPACYSGRPDPHPGVAWPARRKETTHGLHLPQL